ncbi:hypothetical protein [Acinetobacter sp. 256-1]|nr:hypothetical protein [Acinetobacter sp. 256-1]
MPNQNKKTVSLVHHLAEKRHNQHAKLAESYTKKFNSVTGGGA